MMLRTTVCSILLAFLVVVAGPALQPVQADTGVVIRADGLPNPTQVDVTAAASRAVVQAFLDEHPGIRIEPFTMPSIQGSSIDSGPLMAIAAGVPPHAIYVNFRQSSTYMAQGFLEPLEELLARLLSDNPAVRELDEHENWRAAPTATEVQTALEAIRQRVPKAAWPVIYRANETRPGEKHVWAIPTSNLVMALVYRKDLFSEVGLNPDQPPKTWEELLAYSRRLTDPSQGRFGIGIPHAKVISWGIYSFIVSSGGRVVQQTPEGWRASYDTPDVARAVYFTWQLARQDFQHNGQTVSGTALLDTYPEIELKWQQGKVGMRFVYLDEELIAHINPQLVGMAPVPKAPDGERGSEVNCRMLGVFSGSTPAQKLAVMQYIWFTTGEQAQKIRTQVYVENGFGTFVSPRLLRKFGYDRLLRQVPEGWQQAFDEAMSNGVPEPYGRNTQSIYRYLSEPINAALDLPLADVPHDDAIAQIEGLLDASAREVNFKVLGKIPPEVRRTRHIVATLVMLGIAAVFIIMIVHVWRYFTRVSRDVQGNRKWRRVMWGYLMLAPGVLLVLLWQYIPLAGGLGISVTDYRLVEASEFVGVGNFANILYDAKFWEAMGRTFYFVALMIGLGFWPPILLAILLQEVPTNIAKYTFRTIYYLPAVVSGVVVMFLWKQLYSPTENGVLNQLLLSLNTLGPVAATAVKWSALGVWMSLIGLLVMLTIRIFDMSWGLRLGLLTAAVALLSVTLWPVATGGVGVLSGLVGRFELEPLRWTHSPELAMLCVVIPIIWATAGPGCLIYLAALKTIPDDLYEAADIDGAGNWHKVFYIVLPRLRYLIVIQFIAAVVAAFKGGTNYILALTGGGPNDATNILSLEIFTRTFMDLRFGIGTAMAWVLGALLIGFTAMQLKMLSRAEFKTGK